MGILDKYKEFKKNRLNKAIAQNLKVIKNPKAIKEDRVAAIEFFKDLDDVNTAAPALLSRFNYSLEHGINDTREKESALEGVKSFKEGALPHIEQHIQKTDRIAWPLKAYKTIAESDEQIVNALEACLDFTEISFDQGKIDKNYDILCYLRDYKLPSACRGKLYKFLKAHDERLRFAVVEVLLEQEMDKQSETLEEFIFDNSSENSRIKQAVINGFINNKWPIRKSHISEQNPLPNGLELTDQSLLRRKD